MPDLNEPAPTLKPSEPGSLTTGVLITPPMKEAPPPVAPPVEPTPTPEPISTAPPPLSDIPGFHDEETKLYTPEELGQVSTPTNTSTVAPTPSAPVFGPARFGNDLGPLMPTTRVETAANPTTPVVTPTSAGPTPDQIKNGMLTDAIAGMGDVMGGGLLNVPPVILPPNPTPAVGQPTTAAPVETQPIAPRKSFWQRLRGK